MSDSTENLNHDSPDVVRLYALSGPQNHAIILVCSRDYWIMCHHSFDMADKGFKYGFWNYVKFIVVPRYGCLATAEENR